MKSKKFISLQLLLKLLTIRSKGGWVGQLGLHFHAKLFYHFGLKEKSDHKLTVKGVVGWSPLHNSWESYFVSPPGIGWGRLGEWEGGGRFWSGLPRLKPNETIFCSVFLDAKVGRVGGWFRPLPLIVNSFNKKLQIYSYSYYYYYYYYY